MENDSFQLSTHPVLLYDGLCGFCNGAVQFILRHDHRAVFRFAPLQGDFARGILAGHPVFASVDSFLLVDVVAATGEERILARSDAMLRVARELGWPWKIATLLAVVPRFARDAAYDLFAGLRYRLFARYDSCPVPSAEQRGRFMV